MPNPFNPLDWMRSAQDWFSRSERSSGFRPYLIFLLLSMGGGLALLLAFPGRAFVEIAALFLVIFPVLCFVPLFAWKAKTDPSFCRSESHIQRMRKIDLEAMGTESRQIAGEVFVERELEAPTSPVALPNKGQEDGQ